MTGRKEPITLKPGEGFGATGSGNLTAHGPLAFVFVQPGQGKLPEFDVKGKVVIAVCVDAEGALTRIPAGVLVDLRKPGPAAIMRINDVVAARGMTTGDAIRKDMYERNDRAASGGRARTAALGQHLEGRRGAPRDRGRQGLRGDHREGEVRRRPVDRSRRSSPRRSSSRPRSSTSRFPTSSATSRVPIPT